MCSALSVKKLQLLDTEPHEKRKCSGSFVLSKMRKGRWIDDTFR